MSTGPARESSVLELAILGFLLRETLHGYELRRRLGQLTGHFRPVSDGSLYPAIARLERQGFLSRHAAPGLVAAPRQVLELTATGRGEFFRRIREASNLDISDRNRFFTLLAFLGEAPPDDQRRILERRVAFLKEGKSFFLRGAKPSLLAEESDPYRQGMLRLARVTRQAEMAWLEEALAALLG